jgi:hypothetical protein
MGGWMDIGIEIPYGASGEVRLACPQCSASRRKSSEPCLSVNIDKGAWYCWHCGWKGHLGHEGQATPRPLPGPPQAPNEKNHQAIEARWVEASPLTLEDPVCTYLRNRGINLRQHDLPTTVRYHARLAYQHEDGRFSYHPAMVARVDDAVGRMVTLHRTYLTHEGHKADVPTVKKIMRVPVRGGTHGAAVRLYPAGEILCVSEGVETALAVHKQTGLPVWSTYCAGAMEVLMVPPQVAMVEVWADHDARGLKAAKTLQRRLIAAGRRVEVVIPQTPGSDWADPGAAAMPTPILQPLRPAIRLMRSSLRRIC